MFAFQRSMTLDTEQNGRNTAGSIEEHTASQIDCVQNSLIIKTEEYGNFQNL